MRVERDELERASHLPPELAQESDELGWRLLLNRLNAVPLGCRLPSVQQQVLSEGLKLALHREVVRLIIELSRSYLHLRGGLARTRSKLDRQEPQGAAELHRYDTSRPLRVLRGRVWQSLQ